MDRQTAIISKVVATILFLLAALVSSTPARANAYFTLYGYKIGQPIEIAKKKLGKPFRVHRYEDGWVSYAYQLKGHNVYFETSAETPSTISSIQIEGTSNPAHYGLGQLNLGADVGKARKLLGEPVERAASNDVVTKKPIPNTFINYYRGHSYEEQNGKVTSIKVIIDQPRAADAVPDYKGFFQSIGKKDYYRLADMISVYVQQNGKPLLDRPIVEDLQKGRLHNYFYDEQGKPRLLEQNVSATHMRLSQEKGVGHVLKFKDSPVHELVFYKTFEGLVLVDIF